MTQRTGIADANAQGCGAAFVDIDGEVHMNRGDGTFSSLRLRLYANQAVAAPTKVAFSDYDRIITLPRSR